MAILPRPWKLQKIDVLRVIERITAKFCSFLREAKQDLVKKNFCESPKKNNFANSCTCFEVFKSCSKNFWKNQPLLTCTRAMLLTVRSPVHRVTSTSKKILVCCCGMILPLGGSGLLFWLSSSSAGSGIKIKRLLDCICCGNNVALQ